MITTPTSTTDQFAHRPVASRALIEHLKVIFPSTLPHNIEITDRELGALFGVQRVIQYLDGSLNNQEQDTLPHVLKQTQD